MQLGQIQILSPRVRRSRPHFLRNRRAQTSGHLGTVGKHKPALVECAHKEAADSSKVGVVDNSERV